MGKKAKKRQAARSVAESIPDIGMLIDPDEFLYRPLTARAESRGLPAYEQRKMLDIVLYLDQKNPIAHGVLDLLADFVFGEGFSLSFANDQVEALLTAHWNDPYNRWDRRGQRWFRTWLRDGELLPVNSVNAVDGTVRWGSIPSHRIKEVHTDPLNWEIYREVVLYPQSSGDPDQTLNVANIDLKSGHYDAGDGSCMFFKYGGDGVRGISILYPLADMMDGLEQSVFNEIERAALLKSFFLDVTVKGAQPDQIDRMVATEPRFRNPPRPGSLRVHNDQEIWEEKTPSLNAGDGSEFVRLLLTYILGSFRIPVHWFGFGQDSNRATASVMDEPSVKMLSTLQDSWREIMVDLLRYTVDQAVQHGQLPAEVERQKSDGTGTGEMIDPRDAFTLNSPDMDTRDIAQVSAAFAQAMGGVLTAHQEHYISQQTAQQTAWSLLAHLGVELDPSEEADRIQTEQEAEQQQQAQQQQSQAQLLQLAQRQQQQQQQSGPSGQQSPTQQQTGD